MTCVLEKEISKFDKKKTFIRAESFFAYFDDYNLTNKEKSIEQFWYVSTISKSYDWIYQNMLKLSIIKHDIKMIDSCIYW